MRTLFIILLFCSCYGSRPIPAIAHSGTTVAEVSFRAENESGIRYYVLQQSDDTKIWNDVYEVAAKGGGDYQFEVPYKRGFYRLLIAEDWGNRYSHIISLK